MTDQALPDISPSMRRLWRDCGRKVFYRYIAGIDTVAEPKAFAIGLGFHRGIESFRDQPKGTRSMAMAAGVANAFMVEKYANSFPADVLTIMRGQVTAYLMGYAEAYEADQDLEFKPEARAFEGDGEIGFVDSLAYTDDGKTYLIEDKTTGQFVDDAQFLMALKMDDQILTYASALRARGIHLDGIAYRQTLKTKTRVKKNESTAQYIDRVLEEYLASPDKYRQFVVNFTQEQLDLWDKQREKENLNILTYLDVYNLDLWPFNSQACIGPYGPCDYLQLCARRRDARIDRIYKIGKDPLDGGKFRDQIWSSGSHADAIDSANPSGTTTTAGTTVEPDSKEGSQGETRAPF